jgi:hypothetical protein
MWEKYFGIFYDIKYIYVFKEILLNFKNYKSSNLKDSYKATYVHKNARNTQ